MEPVGTPRRNHLHSSMSSTLTSLRSHRHNHRHNDKARSCTTCYTPARRNIPSMASFHLIRIFSPNSLQLDPRVQLMLQHTTLVGLLHPILAVDPVHPMRRPHLISHLRHLIRSRRLYPLYRQQALTEYNWFPHRKYHQLPQATSEHLRAIFNHFSPTMPPTKPC